MAHSNLVFSPPFASNYDFPKKTPSFDTTVQTPKSKRGEIRYSAQPYPIWTWEWAINFMRGAEQVSGSDYQYLLGFYLAMGGMLSDFLLTDQYDNAVAECLFATGDGATTQFQLTRSIGLGTDIVQNVNGTPTVYTAGVVFPPGSATATMGNYLLWSQSLANAVWYRGNIASVTDGVSAPGSATGDEIVTSSATDSYIGQAISGAQAGETVTFSILMSVPSGTQSVNIFVGDSIGSTIASCPVTTTWTRFYVTRTLASGSGVYVQIGGNGSLGANVTLYAAWAQLEPGATQGAYYSTQGTAYTNTVGSTGIVTFATAPVSGRALTWSGSYYYRVRFDTDSLTFEQFMDQLFSMGSLKLRSVIL